MKKLAMLLTGGVITLSFILGALPVQADLEVSASVQIHATADFYAPLSSCGSWVVAGSYGRCWRPAGVVADWRPYCNGYWVWTDCGWYWVSDEPWAWACYHYGNWVYDSIYGWIWVPGVEWAPAWVCWRFGGGYVGWAPVPPHSYFSSGHPVDSAFVFVDNNHFGRRITPASVVANNTAIIRRTTFVSNLEHATRDFAGAGPRKVIINEGPGLAVMEKNTGRKFTAIRVIDANRRTPLPSNFRPPAVPTAINHEQPTLAPPNHNPPVSNEKEPVVPSRKNEPDHSGVPAQLPDSSQGSDSGHGKSDEHGHDLDHE